jgi:hypothetical protein
LAHRRDDDTVWQLEGTDSKRLKALRKRLDEFSDRLRVRMTEFDKKGEFSDTHRALLNQIRQRHDRLGKKVIEAEQKGMT